jgi:hypothetical protein
LVAGRTQSGHRRPPDESGGRFASHGGRGLSHVPCYPARLADIARSRSCRARSI